MPNTIYYRLEILDKDGSKTYSSIVTVTVANSAKLRLNIYPNPVSTTLKAQITTLKAGAATIIITDAQGKILVKQSSQLAIGTSQVSVDIANLAGGNYLLQISGTDFHLQQPFIKE
ncbi:T9SS type A sorting domain-containing protein [Parasediminibacterium paludis]|uniref:T9SS type A sorting domain-containing protein n=1 Tax=Parasediminibacterium paludis TaxID=908966 RepID=UPI00366BC4A6